VYFKNDDDIDEIMAKPTVRESMFTSGWSETRNIMMQGI